MSNIKSDGILVLHMYVKCLIKFFESLQKVLYALRLFYNLWKVCAFST